MGGPATPSPRAEAGLVQAIGVQRLTASIVNVTVGAGIFVLPAIVAAGLGPAAPSAYIACGVAMALVVTCFAAAGSRVSLTGGLYAYIEVAFGPFVGFLGGVLYCDRGRHARGRNRAVRPETPIATVRLQLSGHCAFQLCHQHVKLVDHGLHGLRFAEIDAGPLQQRHGVIAAAGLQKREVPLDRGGALRG